MQITKNKLDNDSLMINHAPYQPCKAKLFNRWSRKSYAVFGSLGCVVHIGRLSVSSAQWVGEIFQHLTEELRLLVKISEEDDDVSPTEINELQLTALTLEVDACSAAINFSENRYTDESR